MHNALLRPSGVISLLRLAIVPVALLAGTVAARGADKAGKANAIEDPAVEQASFQESSINDLKLDESLENALPEAPQPDGMTSDTLSVEATVPDDNADETQEAEKRGLKQPLGKKKGKQTPPGTTGKGATPTAENKSGQPEKLVVGDAYTIEVKRGEIAKAFGGNLLKVSDKWIVLRRMASTRNDYGVPVLASLPKVGTVFRRSYESLVEDDLWIPRDAATVVSHHRVTNTPSGQKVGSDPPALSRCAVAFVQDDKFARRDGNLSAVGSDTVTLQLTTPFRSQYQQQFARDKVLCISIPVVLSNVRTTERDSSQARK